MTSYAQSAKPLIQILHSVYNDKVTELSVLTCDSEYEEDIVELLNGYQYKVPEELLFIADSIEQRRQRMNIGENL